MNTEEIYTKCIEYIKKIRNPILKECCQEIYNDYKSSLTNKPASPGKHHYFRGGLLYHIYCVTRNAYNIANSYEDLNIDMDLIIFGSLLHDIGKSVEYNDYSDSDQYNPIKNNHGKLLGHSYEGVHIVNNYLDKYNLEENFKNQVLHMIGSHMRDFKDGGILVQSKMLEATIIGFADNIDNYIQPAIVAMNDSKESEIYEYKKAGTPYYKSINPYFKNDKIE